MITNNTLGANVFIRITTLWAAIEAFLGGILHAAHFPFSGLVLSLLASICISVLATNGYIRGQILKATLIVIAIKFFMAPHTPPMAYVAVLIEGLFGELIFAPKRFPKLSAFILSLFCVTYSAFQKLIVLTIFYGNAFWESMNTFMNHVAKNLHQQHNVQYMGWIVALYVGIHVVAGIIGGWLNVTIIKNYNKNTQQQVMAAVDYEAYNNKNINDSKKKKRKYFYLWPLMVLVLLLVLSYTAYFKNVIAQKTILMLLVRASIIFIVWKYILVNLTQQLLTWWVTRFQKNNAGQMQTILKLLPTARQVIQYSWYSSATTNKWQQLKLFVQKIIQWVIYAP